MFGRFGTLILILGAYVYLISTDTENTLYDKAKKVYCKIYNDVQKTDLKIKVNKPVNKERRFF